MSALERIPPLLEQRLIPIFEEAIRARVAFNAAWLPESPPAVISFRAKAKAITLQSLAPLPSWVAWHSQLRVPTDAKPAKIPISPNGKRARPNEPRTWGTREQAEERARLLPMPYDLGGIGLMFMPLNDGRNTGGIDLDSCRDPSTGVIADWAQLIIDTFASYTEVSPSKTGVKVFFLYAAAALPQIQAALGKKHSALWAQHTGADHPPAIEVHFSNRYFTVTEEILEGCTDELREIDAAALVHLIRVTGPQFVGASDDDAAIAGRAGGKRDNSRSSHALSIGARARRNGATYEEMCEAIEGEEPGWFAEKGIANGSRELLRIWEKTEPKGATIQIVAGRLDTMTTEAEEAILHSGLPIYQRGGDLVRPITIDVQASRGRMTKSPSLSIMTLPAMIDVYSQAIHWEKYDARAKENLPANPSKDVALIHLSRVGLWKFPSIAGAITTPTIRRDGSLLLEGGYDAATRLYHVIDPDLRLEGIKQDPTRQDAEPALALLKGLLRDFPFDSDVDLAVALSGLITPVVRGALSVAPLTAINASTAGTGKSYLVDLASAISTGRACPVMSAAPEQAETEKRLTGLLLRALPIISIDNVNGEIGGDLLCQATERRLFSVRPFGALRMTEMKIAPAFFATGNGLRVSGDMVRRTVRCTLDAVMERPELRVFRGMPTRCGATASSAWRTRWGHQHQTSWHVARWPQGTDCGGVPHPARLPSNGRRLALDAGLRLEWV